MADKQQGNIYSVDDFQTKFVFDWHIEPCVRLVDLIQSSIVMMC